MWGLPAWADGPAVDYPATVVHRADTAVCLGLRGSWCALADTRKRRGPGCRWMGRTRWTQRQAREKHCWNIAVSRSCGNRSRHQEVHGNRGDSKWRRREQGDSTDGGCDRLLFVSQSPPLHPRPRAHHVHCSAYILPLRWGSSNLDTRVREMRVGVAMVTRASTPPPKPPRVIRSIQVPSARNKAMGHVRGRSHSASVWWCSDRPQRRRLRLRV
jgi:hypothetical protein